MAHRAATDEICVTGGMGNAPSSKRRGLVRVSACCLLAPKDLACHVCREPHITRGERCSLFTCGSQNKQGKRIVTRALSQSLCKTRPQSVHFSYAPYTKSLYKKNRTAALLRVCGLRSLLISAFGAVDDFRSEELRLKIYPQSGANGDRTSVDRVAILIDAAVVVDIRSSVT